MMYVIDLMFAVKLNKRTHLSYCTYIKYQIFLPCSQVTLQAHNGISFWFLHWIKSTPWISCDQGTSRRLTCWEQIDHGLQYTPTRMFLLIIPILLFFLTSFYTRCAYYHERTPKITLVRTLRFLSTDFQISLKNNNFKHQCEHLFKMDILCDSNHFLTVKIRPIAFLPQHGFSRLRHDTETPFVSQEEVIWNQRLLNKSIAQKRQK